jgi:hypothetical protein
MTTDTRLIHLSSRYANTLMGGTDNETSRFRSNINDHIEICGKDIAKVSVRSAELPMMFYQVEAALGNNTFEAYFFPDTLTPIIITIPDGTFSGTSLAEVITTAINDGLTANVTVEYDNTKNKFRFTNVAAAAWQYKFNVGVADLLGFDAEEFYVNNNAAALWSPRLANVQPISTINIHTNLPLRSTYSNRTDGYTTVIERTPVGDLGTVQFYSVGENTFKSRLRSDHISQVEMWLTDENHRPLQLHGNHWNVCLLVEIERADYK